MAEKIGGPGGGSGDTLAQMRQLAEEYRKTALEEARLNLEKKKADAAVNLTRG
jgi:hypothetical protein